MKFKKNLLSNLLLQVISIITGFFTSILIARGLGLLGQGVFAYYTLIFGLIASYGHLGITSSNSYFINKSSYDRKDVINNNISVIIILSLIYLIIISLFSFKIFSSNRILLLLIWTLYYLGILFSNYFITIFVADNQIYIYNKISIIFCLLKGIVVILLYVFNYLNIVSISLVYALSEMFKLILIIFKLKINYKFNIMFRLMKEELNYGFPLYLSALFIYLNYRADIFMVKKFLGNEKLGLYSIAVQLAELAFLFPGAIVSAFEGKLYNCSENDKKELTTLIVRIGFYITLIISIIGILCSPLIKLIYGHVYQKSSLVMIILLIGIVFASIGKITPVYYYTNGNSKVHLKVSLMVLIINIICNFIFIPTYGIYGAAFASTISYTFYGGIYLIVLRKSGFKVIDIFKIKTSDFVTVKNILLSKLKGGN